MCVRMRACVRATQDTIELRFAVNPAHTGEGDASRWICPVTLKEINGRQKYACLLVVLFLLGSALVSWLTRETIDAPHMSLGSSCSAVVDAWLLRRRSSTCPTPRRASYVEHRTNQAPRFNSTPTRRSMSCSRPSSTTNSDSRASRRRPRSKPRSSARLTIPRRRQPRAVLQRARRQPRAPMMLRLAQPQRVTPPRRHRRHRLLIRLKPSLRSARPTLNQPQHLRPSEPSVLPPPPRHPPRALRPSFRTPTKSRRSMPSTSAICNRPHTPRCSPRLRRRHNNNATAK